MLVVQTLADLERVLEPRSRHQSRVVLRLASLEPREAESWERRINTYYRACGCETGAVMMVAAATSMALIAATNYQVFIERPVFWAGLGLLIVCVSLATGKILGLWIARRKLKATIQSIRRKCAVPAAPIFSPSSWRAKTTSARP